jgi:hypothetical protein
MQLYGTGSADLQFRITEPDPGGQLIWIRNTAQKRLVLLLSSVSTGSVIMLKIEPWTPHPPAYLVEVDCVSSSEGEDRVRDSAEGWALDHHKLPGQQRQGRGLSCIQGIFVVALCYRILANHFTLRSFF